MQRRKFIEALGLGSWAVLARCNTVLAASPDIPPRPAAGAGKIRIGSVSWNFHSLAPGAHPEEAIDIIGSLGFESIELIANSRKDVDEYWTDPTIERIKKQVEGNHLVINQYPFFQPVVEGLTSRNATERKLSLDYFERGAASRRNSARRW